MACNTKKNKYDLIRIVKNKKGEILVDKTGKLNGRGAYICNNIECLEKVIKTNRISRVLKSDTEQKIYENIRGVIIGNEQNKQTNS
jgi:predicted RNA-binding protein YlxR (DUF448 family)